MKQSFIVCHRRKCVELFVYKEEMDLLGRVIKKLIRNDERKKAGKIFGHDNFFIGDNVKLYNENIKIGKNCVIYDNVIFLGEGKIVIGDNVAIGYNTIIFSNKGSEIFIGNNSKIAANCYIINMDHSIEKGKSIAESQNIIGDIFIDENVWIGANATVLKKCTIGANTIIGANALVNKTVLPNSIAVGVPIKVISKRGTCSNDETN